MLAKHVWDTLSQIDVYDFTEKKQNSNYLSWAHAWGVMSKHFPDTSYYLTYETFPDGTVEYVCTVTVRHFGEEHCQTMSLPVMDHRNKAIQNPDAFARNTCKMRCLTKCLSMMGLGWYIYAGEDLPIVEPEKISDEQQKELHDLIVETDTDLEKFFAWLKVKALADMTAPQYEKAKAALLNKKAKGEE